MGAGRAFDAYASNIDRRSPGHFREMISYTDELVGVDVRCLGRIRPGPMRDIDRTVVIAIQNNDRARALTSGCREIVTDAEIPAVDVEPNRLRFRSALFARHRDAAKRVFFFDNLRAGWGGRESRTRQQH